MTPEQLAELEQRMLAACRNAVARGVRIEPLNIERRGDYEYNCPMGALTGNVYPLSSMTARELEIPQGHALAFQESFDAQEPPTWAMDASPEMAALGRRFRAMALAGEFGS